MTDLTLEIPRYGTHVPGLPDKAVVLTNSERSRSACPASWLFAYPDRLAPRGAGRGLTWGTAWHNWLEDLHRWWMVHDTEHPHPLSHDCAWCPADDSTGCTHCGGTGGGPLGRTLLEWARIAEDSDTVELDAMVKDHQTLVRAAYGWLHTYGAAPPEDYRVVGVEERMAVPITNPSGQPYRPQTWVVPDDGGGIRLAGTGEAHNLGAQIVRWPWYQALTLDVIFQHRESGNLYVGEHKSAASPTSRVQAVIIDPQLAGYVWAAGVALECGTLNHLGLDRDCKVRGYRYDVASNRYQPDPKLLAPAKVQARDENGHPLWKQTKAQGGGVSTTETSRKAWELDEDGDPVLRSPGLSTSTSAAVPSWRYRAAIEAHGFDVADYEGHMLDLSAVDGKLYQRLNGTSGPEVGARYARELYATAQKLSTWRRRAALLTTQAERDLHFPRQPVCMTGYSCPWRGPCLQDGDMVRRDFDQAGTQRWVPADNNDNPDQGDLGW